MLWRSSILRQREAVWRSRNYLDCDEAIALVLGRRTQLAEVCKVFEQARRFVKEKEELNDCYNRFGDFCNSMEKAVAVVEGLAEKDDLVLLARDPMGRYELRAELAQATAELKEARRLLDQLRSRLS
jgi:hypothetical protein